MKDPDVSIREARSSDIDRIAELLSELAGQELTREGARDRFDLVARDPDQEMAVAIAGEELVGLMAFRIRHNIESVSHYGEIASLVVDNAWRGRGVGCLLMERAERMARERGCLGLWLVSGFGREKEAHKFYARLGFEKTGVRMVKRL